MVKLVEYDADLLQQHRHNLDARNAPGVRESACGTVAKGARAGHEKGESKSRGEKKHLLSKIRHEQGSYESAMQEFEEGLERALGLYRQTRARAQTRSGAASPRATPAQQQARARPTGAPQPPPPSATSTAIVSFGKLRGQLAWPISGKLVSTYGKIKHPTFNTYTFNKGIGISAAPGSDFRVIEAGEVLFADWFKGYGNLDCRPWR